MLIGTFVALNQSVTLCDCSWVCTIFCY